MKSLDPIAAQFAYGAVAVATAVLALAAAPADSAGTSLSPLIVPSMTGPGSINGVWGNPGDSQTVKTADGKPVPYRPEIAQQLAQQHTASSPSVCVPAGMPTMMEPSVGLPLDILEMRGQTTVLFGDFGTFRIIHMNDKHLPDPDPGYFGDSVGHWQGNTLVVDTIALTDKTTFLGALHSEAMHLIERIHRVDASTLQDRLTIEDPKTYTRPWTWVITLKRVPETQLKEYPRHPC